MSEIPGGFRQTPDRRLHTRRVPTVLTYVEIGDNNGGIMLNLSEGGIAITAAEVLASESFPRIRFQLPQSDGWIEGSGQLVWISASRKEAGIQFVSLSEEARLCIREWVAPRGPVRAPSPSVVSAEKRKPFLEMPSPRKARNVATERPTPGPMVDEELDALFPSESAIAERREEKSRTVVRGNPPQAASPPPRDTPAASAPPPPIAPPPPTAAAPSAAAEPARVATAVEERPVAASRPIVKPPDPPVFQHSAGDSILKLGWHAPSLPIEPYVERRSSGTIALLVLVIAAIAFAAGIGFARGSFAKWYAEMNYPAQSAGPAAKTEAPPPTPNAGDNAKSSATNGAAQNPLPSSTSPQNPSLPAANSGDATPDNATVGTPMAGSVPASAAPALSQKTVQPAASNVEVSDQNANGSGDQASTADQTRQPILVDAPAAGSPPLMLNLPEVAVSASGYVAITDRRIVYVPASAGPEGSSSRVRVLVGSLMFHAEPLYSAEARQRRVEGTVELHATVDADGEVARVQPLSGPTLLIPAAVNAVREWQYKPTLLNGQPVPTQEDITVAFRLP